jgi:hypothetical protein
VLGVMKGFSGLPEEMKKGIEAIGDSVFINTNYSFNKAVSSTYDYATRFIETNGGTTTGNKLKIKVQNPVAPQLEVSFPNLVFDTRISVTGDERSSMTHAWKKQEVPAGKNPNWIFAGESGDSITFTFEGSGISINGNWVADGGKADIFIDGKPDRTIDTYYNWSRQQHNDVSIWHNFSLHPGTHKVKLVVRGEKRPESIGTNVYISSANIFKTALKKNDYYKFSFENNR